MRSRTFDLESLLLMAHSPVRNYAIPGLTSFLIGQPSGFGSVRLFHSEREHQESITPHSHRFGFQCLVLRGNVRNRLWRQVGHDAAGDLYRTTTLRYLGGIGKYERTPGDVCKWSYTDECFTAGECYGMSADEVHSIFFSRDALVLFLEGQTVADHSIALEPVVDGETIPTLETQPWMFRRG